MADRTLSDLMSGFGDPTSVDDVVRRWLGTKTWNDSFEVLAAGQEVLVSQDGLDAVMNLATPDEQSVHAAILQAVGGGLDVEFVRMVVIDRDAAREVAKQALRNGHEPVLRVVLALNSELGASDEGAALFLASLVVGDAAEAERVCRAAATSDPQGSARVAAQIENLVGEGLVAADDAASLIAALRG